MLWRLKTWIGENTRHSAWQKCLFNGSFYHFWATEYNVTWIMWQHAVMTGSVWLSSQITRTLKILTYRGNILVSCALLHFHCILSKIHVDYFPEDQKPLHLFIPDTSWALLSQWECHKDSNTNQWASQLICIHYSSNWNFQMGFRVSYWKREKVLGSRSQSFQLLWELKEKMFAF